MFNFFYHRAVAAQLSSRRTVGKIMRWDTSLPDQLVDRLWSDPRGLLNTGELLQHKPRCTVVCLDCSSGPFVLKYHNWGGLCRTLTQSLRRATAKGTWIESRILYAAGVPTPRPRAYFERCFGPVGTSSYLLTDYVQGTSLYRFLRYQRPSRGLVEHLASQVAAIWQQLDDLSTSHNDLKLENFLVDRTDCVWLIDLERVRRHRQRKEVRRRQLRDAAELLHPRNWHTEPGAAEIFRRALLRTPAAVQAVAGNPHGHPLGLQRPPHNRRSHLISALIPTLNSASTIVACLQSVQDWADEIVVADRGSTDSTLRLVSEFGGCKIARRSTNDSIDFAIWSHRQANYAWVLRILPHERLDPELGREIQVLLAAEPDEDAFRIWLNKSTTRRWWQIGRNQSLAVRLYRTNAIYFVRQGNDVEVVVPSQRIGFFSDYSIAEVDVNLCWTGRFAEFTNNDSQRLQRKAA